jgi:hypothetical protein
MKKQMDALKEEEKKLEYMIFDLLKVDVQRRRSSSRSGLCVLMSDVILVMT